MGLVAWLKTTPLWLALPSLLVAVVVGGTVVNYEPLVFDPTLYETPAASAAQLSTTDAAAAEKDKKASVAADPIQAVGGELADGTWTGYAACGTGNPDGWKPYYVCVTIEVSGGKVVRIARIAGSSEGNAGDTALDWDASENQEYLDWGIDGRGSDTGVKSQIEGQLPTQGDIGAVDTVSGATYSSTAIYNAFVDAVNKAARSGGASASPAKASPTSTPAAKKKQSAGKRVKSGKLADGTWTGYAECGPDPDQDWKPYYVGVSVRVKGGKAIRIEKVWGSSTGDSGSKKLKWDKAENQKYLTWADSGKSGQKGVSKQVNALLKKGASVSNVDTVSGATYSSTAIYNAYADALNKSAKAAGAKTKVEKKKTTKKKKKTTATKVEADTNVGKLADGTWTGYAKCGPDPDEDWKPYYVCVELTVKNGKVASVDKIYGTSTGEAGSAKLDWDADENATYMDGAVYSVSQQLNAAAAQGKTASRVDTVSGATYSSKAAFEAYYAALKKSAAAAGSSIDEPQEGDGEPQGVGVQQEAAGPQEAENAYYGYAYCSSSGADSWSPYYIFVKLTAGEGSAPTIADVYGDAEGIVEPDAMYNASENAMYLNWAIDGKFGGLGYRMKSVVKQIQEKLDAGSTVSGISTVSGATRSSKAILEAYEMAAANAERGVGKTPQEAASASG